MARVRAVVVFIGRSSRRVAVTLVGAALLLAGAVMLVTPGPGLLVVIAGLAVLASEYVWAQRALEAAHRRAVRSRDKLRQRRDLGRAQGPARRDATGEDGP